LCYVTTLSHVKDGQLDDSAHYDITIANTQQKQAIDWIKSHTLDTNIAILDTLVSTGSKLRSMPVINAKVSI